MCKQWHMAISPVIEALIKPQADVAETASKLYVVA